MPPPAQTWQVSCGGITYRLVRFYSEFRAMHRRLQAAGVPDSLLPPLPPKRSMSSQDQAFAERRRVELEGYVYALVTPRQLRATAELQRFLELSALTCRTRTTTLTAS